MTFAVKPVYIQQPELQGEGCVACVTCKPWDLEEAGTEPSDWYENVMTREESP